MPRQSSESRTITPYALSCCKSQDVKNIDSLSRAFLEMCSQGAVRTHSRLESLPTPFRDVAARNTTAATREERRQDPNSTQPRPFQSTSDEEGRKTLPKKSPPMCGAWVNTSVWSWLSRCTVAKLAEGTSDSQLLFPVTDCLVSIDRWTVHHSLSYR